MGKFNNLPKEILLEILTRLPTESVLECKSVCKPWRDVVRHPSFSQMHLNRLNSSDDDSGKLGFIFYSREPAEVKEFHDHFGESCFIILRYNDVFEYSKYDENCRETPFTTKTRMDLNLPVKDFSFASSCNGLICFRSWCKDSYGPVYICNPVTREYIILPNNEGQYWLNGFGYSPSTNEYKVVRIRRSKEDEDVIVVQVYTLGSGIGWRSVANTDINIKYVTLCPGVFANGALHWADHDERTILAFHLAEEKCSERPYPPCLTQIDNRYLGVLGDFLSVTCHHYATACDIWLLKKNKDNDELSWSKEFSFEIYIPRPFGVTKSGRLLCYEGYKIFDCDLKASSAKMDVSFGKIITEAIPHTNTLVSLKVLGERDAKTMESSGSASVTASEAMECLALEAPI